ncbi:MAG TPA: CU044_2847 family protein [Nostoc sp.]|uniref:CU044_2847 family protein n=1 Tax=Nostoc sp. TaxID=1180 RepID=UPI002D2B021E|nr:CU044_2847 family protein [Nostoc sp.]HYX14579.1 CU044_2847 family protein [Nostoc sp.]
MARKLLELNTEDGSTILVAVELPDASVGRVSLTGELPIDKVEANFDAVKDLIVRGCRPITKAFRTLQQESQPVSAEVEFGVNFTAKGSVYVVESTGQASLKVKITWKLASEENK